MNIESIFKHNVSRIIIESYNLCNRKCHTCPQALGIRGNKYEEFSQELFEKLLKDLSKIDYSNTIAIGRYHEPLMYSNFTIERIKSIRVFLPKAKILLNTNGDFITEKLIVDLANAGLSSLKIMCYQDYDYSDKVAEKLCMNTIERLGLKTISVKKEPNVIFKYEVSPILNMKIAVKSENYSVPGRGCDRGGLLEELSNYKRTEACDVPLKNIDIDYNGCVLPCNNLLSDAPQHKAYVFGNLSNSSIFEIYKQILSSSFTKRISNGNFCDDKICQNCSYFYTTSEKSFIRI